MADTLKGAVIRVACQAVVLVDEAAETVAAVDRAHTRSFLWLVRVGRTKFKGRMHEVQGQDAASPGCNGRRRCGARFRGGVGRARARQPQRRHMSAAIAGSRQGPHPGFVDHVHVALALSLAMPTAAVAIETRVSDARGAMHGDRARSPGVGAQCGMIRTSIGKYCGAPPSGGGPPMTSPSAGPSFSSMKRSKASRDSQTS